VDQRDGIFSREEYFRLIGERGERGDGMEEEGRMRETRGRNLTRDVNLIAPL